MKIGVYARINNQVSMYFEQLFLPSLSFLIKLLFSIENALYLHHH
jgi:hypothetical protein